MSDNKLTEEECRKVARVIDGVVRNTRHPSIDDWQRFTLLMYELHQKRFNLPGVNMREDFAPYCERPFPDNVIEEMQVRIESAADLVWILHERKRDGMGDILKDF